ncbi:hypothetical protein GCM10010289_53480 [Streptomyces violascens]|uniref:DUF6571 domain-containing protein n=1 Tax=Streptomyces violascens TaxID=67381 RepID=A0ABQ3QNU9_9ACTN|nr:hypothetical protein GCM10010289_53480 [Streptomyces violascens]GHI38943.1 hypothetical protein Sviol_33510 [Streptomyces violascens]
MVNAPVDKLKTAVDDWSDMARSLKRLSDEAHDGMRVHAETARWAGVNAGVTREFVRKTVKEFADAEQEAEGVHRLLLDAYTEFKKAKDGLQAVLDGAEQNGIAVDGKGRVVARHPVADDAARRHDPEYDGLAKDMKAEREHVAAWQRKVDALIAGCDAADESLRLALTANLPNEHDFSAPRFASLDDEEAARAVDLAKRVTGEGGTARNVEELKQLQTLLDANAQDPEFSTSFYRRLGAQGTLGFYTRLSLDATGLGPAGLDRAAMVRHVQDDLGPMLGLATNPHTPGHLDGPWTTDLMRAGRRPVDVSGFAGAGTKVYGYQALGALLRHGTYDREFLLPVARDMVGFEHQNPKVFEQGVPQVPGMALNLDPSGGRGFDPLTGLMSAMSNNPESSAEFFNEPVRSDSDGNGLVTADDAAVRAPGGGRLSMVDHLLDKPPTDDRYDALPDARTPYQSALGNALEAAVTGRIPGDETAKPVEHTAAMANVMEKVVAKIGADPSLILGEDDAPGKLEGLSGNFGNMAAEYMADIQARVENGADQAKPFGVLAKFADTGQLAHFLGAVAQDPDAYGAITNAQQAYTTLLVRDVFAHPENHGSDVGEAIRNAVYPGGEISGIMTQARVEAIYEKHSAADAQFNTAVEDNVEWTNRIIDAVGAKYVEMIPVGGDAVEWLKEEISKSSLENAQQDSSGLAAQEAATAYSQAEEKVKRSAADAVSTAGRSAGAAGHDVQEYRGTASTGAAAGHVAGRSFLASSTAPGGGK